MSETAPLRIPVVVDGHAAVADFEKLAGAAGNVRKGVESVRAAQALLAEAQQRTAAFAESAYREQNGGSKAHTAAIRAETQAMRTLTAVTRAYEAAQRQANDAVARAPRAADRKPRAGRTSGGNGAANAAVISFSQGLEDASFGLLNGGSFSKALQYSGNNLSQFVGLLGQAAITAKETGTTVASGLTAALTGAGGLVLGLTLVSTVLPAVISLFGQSSDALDETAEAAKRTADAYQEAVTAAIDFAAATDAAIDAAARRARQELQYGGVQDLNDVLGWDQQPTPAGRLGDPLSVVALDSLAQGFRGLTAARDGSAASGRAAAGASGAEADALRAVAAGADAARASRERLRRVQEIRDRYGLQSPEATRAARDAARDAERDAERARKKAERDAATAARRAAREALRDARQAAEDQHRLRLELDEAEAQEGLARDLVSLKQRTDQRLAAAHGEATLIARVNVQAARDRERLEQRDGEALIARQQEAIDQIREARDQADRQSGTLDEQIAQRRIEQIRGEAAVTVDTYAAQAEAAGQVVPDLEEMVQLLNSGNYEAADTLGLYAAMSPALKPILTALLEKLRLEGNLAGLVRQQRIDREAEARATRSAERERADRSAAASRVRDRGGRPAGDTGREDAARALARAQADVADLDAALQALGATGEETAATEAGVFAEVSARRETDAAQIRDLSEKRRAAAERVKDAEVDADAAAADAATRTFEKRRQAVLDLLDITQDAFTRQRRFTDLDLEVQRERYRQEREDLRKSLADREIDQREYSLRIRQLAQEEGEYQRTIDEDRTSASERLARGLTAVVGDELKKRAAGYVAEAIAFALGESTKTGAAAAGSAARIGLLLKEGAADLVAAGKVMVGAVAKVIKQVIDLIPFPANLAVIPIAAGALYGAYKCARGLFFADGGPVRGPGGPREDKIPAYLSNGEHVLTAAEVQALGGHSEVERFRALVLAGRVPAFADGGAASFAVRPLYTPPPMPARVSPASLAPAATAPDLAPLLAEMQQARRDNAALIAKIEKLAAPRVITDPDARRIRRQASRETYIRTGRR